MSDIRGKVKQVGVTAVAVGLLLLAALVAGCSPTASWYDTARPLLAAFDDQTTTASSTPRNGLAPVILAMQSTAREVQAIQTDSAAHAQFVEAMQLTVAYFQAFSASQPDEALTRAHDAAQAAWDEANRLLQQELNYLPPAD